MLGQPIYMVTPQVVGFKLHGKLPEGATATDLVLVITQILRSHGVVEKFVEFYRRRAWRRCRSPTARPSPTWRPEYGATMGFFPVDEQTLAYLRLTGARRESHRSGRAILQGAGPLADRESRAGVQRSAGAGSGHGDAERRRAAPAAGSRGTARREAGLPLGAGRRVQEKRRRKRHAAARSLERRRPGCPKPPQRTADEDEQEAATSEHLKDDIRTEGAIAVLEDRWVKLTHGDVVIAAITSCTNTSNPSVMIAAGLLAKKAVEHGLKVPPYVKTSSRPARAW